MFSYSLSYMVRVICCNLAWILEPVKFSLLPLIYKFWTFFVNPSLMLFLFVTTHNLSLADTLMLCVIVSEGLLLSFKLLKEPKLFQILSWFFSVSSTLFRFLRLKLSFKLLCYFFTDWQSLPTFFKHRMVMNNVRSSERSDIKYWYYDWMPFPTYKGLDQCDCESSLEETPECNLFIMGQHSTFDVRFFGWQYLRQQTLINADVIFLYIVNRVPAWLSVPCSVDRVQSRVHSVPPGSRLPYGTRTSPVLLQLSSATLTYIPRIPSSKSHEHLFYSKCSVPRLKPYVTFRDK